MCIASKRRVGKVSCGAGKSYITSATLSKPGAVTSMARAWPAARSGVPETPGPTRFIPFDSLSAG